jgi:hypothetical protein
VLRLIAIDRAVHFLVLSALAAAVFLFASNKAALNADFTRILKDLQGGLGGPVNNTNHGILHDLSRLFAVSVTNVPGGRGRRCLCRDGGARGNRAVARPPVG